jgi:hypothetical protein
MRKENCKGEEQGELPRDPLGGSSSVSSPHQSSPTQLHLQPQAQQADGKNERHPVQQHLLQPEIQRTDLSVKAPSSSNNDTVATIVHQIMTELSEAPSQEDRIMDITKMVLNFMKQNG